MLLRNISNFALLGCHPLTILPLLIACPLHESFVSRTEDITSVRQDVLAYAQEMTSTEIISAPLSKRSMFTSGDTLAYTSSMDYAARGAIATCSAIAFNITFGLPCSVRIPIQG